MNKGGSSDVPFKPGEIVDFYARDSGGDHQEASVSRQINAFQSWCKDNSLIPGQIFKDEARPGSSVVGRKGFQEMMHYYRSGQATDSGSAGLAIWNFQRFSRDLDESQFYRADIRRMGFTFHSLNDYIPEGPIGRVFEAILDWKNAEFLVDLGIDVSDGLRELVQIHGAVPGTPPRGFRRELVKLPDHRDDKPHIAHRWTPDPDYIPKIRRAFEMLLTGKSLLEITTETGLYKSVNSYLTFFSNPIYKGILEYGDLVVENYCEPIVDPATWEQAQTIIKARSRRKHLRGDNPRHPRRVSSDYLLSGFLYCARCNSPMSGNRAGSTGGKKYQMYICSSAKRNHDCDAEMLPKQFTEELIIRLVKQFILSSENLQLRQTAVEHSANQLEEDVQVQRKELQKGLVGIRKKITNIADSLAESGRSRTLLSKLTDLEAEEATLLASINQLDNQVRAAQSYTSLKPEELAAMGVRLSVALETGETKKVLAGIISRAVIEREGREVRVEIHYYFPPEERSKPPPTNDIISLAISHNTVGAQGKTAW